MPFELKLLLFFIFIFGLQIWITYHPRSFLARALLSWQGPFPRNNESEAHFTFRCGLWASKWFLQIVIITAAGVYLFESQYNDSYYVQAIFNFCLPMLGIIALFGALALFVNSLRVKLKGPQRYFRSEPEGRWCVTDEPNP